MRRDAIEHEVTMHIVFFLRHFNDLDNILPVIDFALSSERDLRVSIVSYSTNINLSDNRLLNYIIGKYPTRSRFAWVMEMGSVAKRGSGIGLLAHEFRDLFRIWQRRSKAYESQVRGDSSNSLLEEFLREQVWDWGSPITVAFDQNRMAAVRGLVECCRRLGARNVVSLPVSPWMNINVLRQKNRVLIDSDIFARVHDFSGYDKIGQTDLNYAQNVKRFFQILNKESPFGNRVFCLGSLRYTDEWIKKRRKIMRGSDVSVKVGQSGDEILLLPSHQKNNSFWDEFVRTVSFLTNFPQIQFLLKPHTRHGSAGLELLPNVEMCASADTGLLIERADVIAFWSSSSAIEGFMCDKTMIRLEYLNGNYSAYKKLQLGYECLSRDDLFYVLLDENERNRARLQCEYAKSRVISEIVGGSYEQVGEKYLEFLLS